MTRGARLREHWRSVDPRVVDGCVAGALFAEMVLELATRPPEAGQHRAGLLAYGLAAAICLPYAVHRRRPMAATAVTAVAMLAYALGRFNGYPGYAVFALLFGVTLHAGRRQAAVTYVTCVVSLGVALALQPPDVATPATYVSTFLAATVAALGGANVRARRARWSALENRARRLELEREERTRQAVTEERLRIARELHDVVAHSMSVIAVQAGVAHHVLDSRPELARQALGTVEEISRSALVEMRRLLGVLRQDGEQIASLTPAPGLADVPSLVRQLGDAGLRVEVSVVGLPRELPPGVDLSAYRIVQEGLTNVLRHGGRRAEAVIAYEPGDVVIEIADEGRQVNGAGRSVAGAGTGQGLIGMRERVAIFGGELAAGPRPHGGFRVRATLPSGPDPRGGAGT